ncbi:MAG: type II toxin-antitoxin system HicB family antitoxin [Pseudonocardia sp.]|nr:type II toxin-antitoxin system HicB family antitoxin [Pseudonocardia sp.]
MALGDTFDECLAEMRDAVAFHLDGMREDGAPIPLPVTKAATVDAA